VTYYTQLNTRKGGTLWPAGQPTIIIFWKVDDANTAAKLSIKSSDLFRGGERNPNEFCDKYSDTGNNH
jgi:hypothetical protein